MGRAKRNLIAAVIGVFLAASSGYGGPISFYDDAGDWLADFGGASLLVDWTTANEINQLVAGTSYGGTLTFDKANTNLPFSFNLNTLQSGAEFIWNENQGNPKFVDSMSVGRFNQHQDDDWEMVIYDGSGPIAVGFVIGDNAIEVGEMVVVDDAGGWLGSFRPNSSGQTGAFHGILTESAIVSIRFDEHAGPDDISLRSITIGVPEPATVALLGIGAVALVGRRRRR